MPTVYDSHPPTLVSHGAEGQSHITVTHPVIPGSWVTVGAREPVWEAHRTWLCTGTGPFTLHLGEMNNPTHLAAPHMAGTPVEVAE